MCQLMLRYFLLSSRELLLFVSLFFNNLVSRKKTIVNNKSVVLVFASLSFLVAGFIYVSISERPAIAYSPAYCFTQYHCKDRTCTDKSDGVTRTCCWTSSGYTVCQTCTLNKNTGYYGNCSSTSNFSSGGVQGTDTSPPLVA